MSTEIEGFFKLLDELVAEEHRVVKESDKLRAKKKSGEVSRITWDL